MSEETVPKLALRRCEPNDLVLLARMNRELIEDEGHRNPMTVPQLKQRFERFITEEGWNVDVILLGNEIAGFATHRYEPDVAEPDGTHVRLRQFYIARSMRRGGIGRSALELLIAERFRTGDRIFLEVFVTIPGGKIFWSRTGFKPYATTMERLVEMKGRGGTLPMQAPAITRE